jgi:hypothetical protein
VKKIMIFLSLSILISLTAEAAKSHHFPGHKLVTAALWPKSPHMFTCSLTNTTIESHMVRIRIVSEGNTLKESAIVSLGGERTLGLDIEGFPNGGYMFCEFTVEGMTEWYRGVAKMYSNEGGDFIAVDAK